LKKKRNFNKVVIVLNLRHFDNQGDSSQAKRGGGEGGEKGGKDKRHTLQRSTYAN